MSSMRRYSKQNYCGERSKEKTKFVTGEFFTLSIYCGERRLYVALHDVQNNKQTRNNLIQLYLFFNKKLKLNECEISLLFSTWYNLNLRAYNSKKLGNLDYQFVRKATLPQKVQKDRNYLYGGFCSLFLVLTTSWYA